MDACRTTHTYLWYYFLVPSLTHLYGFQLFVLMKHSIKREYLVQNHTTLKRMHQFSETCIIHEVYFSWVL